MGRLLWNGNLTQRDGSFSSYAKFSEELILLTLRYAHVRVRIWEQEMLLFSKILNTCFRNTLKLTFFLELISKKDFMRAHVIFWGKRVHILPATFMVSVVTNRPQVGDLKSKVYHGLQFGNILDEWLTKYMVPTLKKYLINY